MGRPSTFDSYKDLLIDEDSVKWFPFMYHLHKDAEVHPNLIEQLEEYAKDAPPSHIVKVFRYFLFDYVTWEKLCYHFESSDEAYELLKNIQLPPPYVPSEAAAKFRWNWGGLIFDLLNNYFYTLGSDRALRARLWQYAEFKGIANSVVVFYSSYCERRAGRDQ
jgi:hypothetical protein